MNRLSSETFHATTVALDGRAVMITGQSGSGKSDLALRLIDRGFVLVSDDQTIVSKAGDGLVASAPATIAGQMEVRGIGIVPMESATDARLALMVELTGAVERMPDERRERTIVGVNLPLISIDPREASAAIKVSLALARLEPGA